MFDSALQDNSFLPIEQSFLYPDELEVDLLTTERKNLFPNSVRLEVSNDLMRQMRAQLHAFDDVCWCSLTHLC